MTLADSEMPGIVGAAPRAKALPLPDEFAIMLRATASLFGVLPSELTSAGRSGTVASARHVAVWLARDVWGYSYPQLGKLFGGRDHTTAMNSVKRVEKSAQLRLYAETVRSRLTGERVLQPGITGPLDWDDIRKAGE